MRDRLVNRGALRWYLGTLFGLGYQSIELIVLWTDGRSLAMHVLATLALVVIAYVPYVVIPPLTWERSLRTRVIVLAAYWVASFALIPLIGWNTIWLWLLLASMIAFSNLPARVTYGCGAVIVLVQLLIGALQDFEGGLLFAPVVTLSVFISLIGVSRQITVNRELRIANTQVATLAAAEERARLARDLHDVLGHSLTVVAVKSELARKLVAVDPRKAEAEIADIEALTRDALADLRAAVSNYRAMTLETELASARTAFDAAGITAHLPADATVADPALQPVLAWVLREGVTNVIRHSGATEAWIELSRQRIVVRDNGAGPVGPEGNGLSGLRERAEAVGATLRTSSGRGFALTVERTP